MGHKSIDLDWANLLPGRRHSPRPSPVPPPPEAAGDVVLSPTSDLSRVTDHELEDKIKRLSKVLSSKLPDGGLKVRATLHQVRDELDRRKLDRIQKDLGECQRPMQSQDIQLSEGFGPNISSTKPDSQEMGEEKTGAAFRNELTYFFRDSYKCTRENGLQMQMENQELQNPSQLVRMPSKDVPSACNAKKDKQQLLSNKRKDIGISSTSSSHAGRKQSRRLSKRRRPPSKQDSRYPKFEKVQHVVLLDDEDIQLADSIDGDDVPNEWKNKFYYPSRDDPECVQLYYSDIECLNPETYLSSPIMNFYIQYLQRSTSSFDKRRGEYYIFNTYFYSKLEEAVSCKVDRSSSFLKLRRWWKGVDLFQKTYILLPIYRDKHWSLVIISIPGKHDETGLIVLHLDSLGLHASSHIFSAVHSYLKQEWSYINENALPLELPISQKLWNHLPRRIEKEKILVPQQKNDYDCGLFVLYFMERFIAEAPERLRKKDLSMFGRKWFKPEEASSLRRRIRELFIAEFEGKRLDGETGESSIWSGAP